MITFRVLGEVSLEGVGITEGEHSTLPPQRLALATYLLLHSPGGYLTRDHLIGVFWPESTESNARNSLSVDLSHIRGSLGPEALRNRGREEVGIVGEKVTCDAIDFARAIEEADWSGAATLYRGPLLDGFFLGCNAFDDWLSRTRMKLERQALVALERLAEAAISDGDVAGATSAAERAFEIAPRRGDTARGLMTALALAGRAEAAEEVFESHARSLRSEDADAEPSAETRSLIGSILRGERPSSPHADSVGDTLSFEAPTGRGADLLLLQQLTELLSARAPGPGRTVFTDHVEPLFAELTTIHSDYLQAFVQLRQQSSVERGEDVLAMVRLRRAKLAPVRAKVSALAAVVDQEPQGWPPEFTAFAARCASYFHAGTDMRTQLGPQSAFTSLVRDLERHMAADSGDQTARDIVVDWVDRSRAGLELRWSELTEAYARARLALLRSS